MPAEKLLDPRLKPVMIVNNASSQALMKDHEAASSGLRNNVSEESIELNQGQKVKSPNYVSKADWITLAILTFVNLINYMDRYTIAGILSEVRSGLDINNEQAGLLQTAFVASFMIFAPLFGYLGDRFNRKWVMVVGIAVWSVATLLGSFMEDFYSFLVMRAIVGIGEASYTTIAPTILSDLFVKEMRSKALAIFYFAIPVGSGLGYVVGQGLSSAFGSWHWALRGTPILGAFAVLGIVFFLKDPPRGESEGHDQLKATSYTEDLKSLMCNKSFILTTLGFTCVTFCTGALGWWGNLFLVDAVKAMGESEWPMDPEGIPFVFGIVTMLSGVVGVPVGSILSVKLRPKFARTDPIICGLGLVIASIFLCIAIFTCNYAFILAFVLIFFGEIALNLNWSIVADILLYVVAPTRRGTAEAIQILFSHLFGDAGSPYLIGVVSDSLKKDYITNDFVAGIDKQICPDHIREFLDPEFKNVTILTAAQNETITICNSTRDFYSMQYSLIINIFMVFLGGICFFLSAIYIIKDKERVERFVADEDEQFRDEKEDMIKSESNSQWSEDDSPPILVASKNNQNSTEDEKSRQIDAANKLEPLLKPLATFKPETETNQHLPRV
jgi:MFS family permease